MLAILDACLAVIILVVFIPVIVGLASETGLVELILEILKGLF